MNKWKALNPKNLYMKMPTWFSDYSNMAAINWGLHYVRTVLTRLQCIPMFSCASAEFVAGGVREGCFSGIHGPHFMSSSCLAWFHFMSMSQDFLSKLTTSHEAAGSSAKKRYSKSRFTIERYKNFSNTVVHTFDNRDLEKL